MRPFWSFKVNMAVIDGVIMKGRCIIIPKPQQALKQQALDQLHVNHMGIEKTKLLACKSIYWVNVNSDIENYIKNCTTCLAFQQMQPKEKIIHHDIPIRPWDILGADMFHINNKNYLCIVDYHSKFLVVKKTKGLSADSLILAFKIVFSEYRIPKQIMSDAGGNFISEKFKNFCNILNTAEAESSTYHHQSNRQVEVCIKFIKCTVKKCFNSRSNMHIALLQIRTTPLGAKPSQPCHIPV